MPAALRPSILRSHRLLVLGLLLVGATAAVLSYRSGREEERRHALSEFDHHSTLRQALTREILGHYEDALFGLSALFMVDGPVSRAEFDRAAVRLQDRIPGAHVLEWVPLVAADERAAVEASLARPLTELDPGGQPRPAGIRPQHYPIVFVYPLAGNEAALGYDLTTGPTRDVLERARETRQMTLSRQVQLVQERNGKLGVIMILPIFRAAAEGEAFRGFLQCVVRVHDLLATTQRNQPEASSDMLFLDLGESEPARRVLYYRPADGMAAAVAPSEAEFRRGHCLEREVSFGHRDWRVLYRPRAGWVESQFTSMPPLRAGSLFLLSVLLGGIVHILGRRAEMVRQEVEVRTAELAESRRHLASMLHALPGMAYRCTYDEQMTVLFLSEGAFALTGWTTDEFIGGRSHFRDCIHPEDLPRVREATRAALSERTDIEVEYRIRTKSAGEKWVLSRGRGVYGEGGALDFFEGLAIDITAQKKAETARIALERKLLEGQKLESLGLLAGGIAHDFNNLLSSILGNASLARLAAPAENNGEAHLRAIETAALRAAELCHQMLAYAGKGRFVIEPTNLTVLAEDLLPLLRISTAHQAGLKLELARDLPPVMADATQLRQIVMNLVLNAADAIANGRGEIVITTGVMHADAALLGACVAGAGLPAGDYVFLEVRDTGCGMSAETMGRIFDPFFTTKFAGRGLGLAAVLGIVRGHAGALRVTSTVGAGSIFRLLLPPARSAAPVAAKPEAGATGKWNRAGHVLVVEDEDHVRRVMVEMLRSFGLAATGFADGRAAVEAFRANADGISLVLLDLLMPGMSGEQTLEALRAVKPGVRVLLVSGYSEGDLLGRLGGGTALGFLAKPFTRDGLKKKLQAMLD